MKDRERVLNSFSNRNPRLDLLDNHAIDTKIDTFPSDTKHNAKPLNRTARLHNRPPSKALKNSFVFVALYLSQ